MREPSRSETGPALGQTASASSGSRLRSPSSLHLTDGLGLSDSQRALLREETVGDRGGISARPLPMQVIPSLR
jgi:hypothetical protein